MSFSGSSSGSRNTPLPFNSPSRRGLVALPAFSSGGHKSTKQRRQDPTRRKETNYEKKKATLNPIQRDPPPQKPVWLAPGRVGGLGRRERERKGREGEREGGKEREGERRGHSRIRVWQVTPTRVLGYHFDITAHPASSPPSPLPFLPPFPCTHPSTPNLNPFNPA